MCVFWALFLELENKHLKFKSNHEIQQKSGSFAGVLAADI